MFADVGTPSISKLRMAKPRDRYAVLSAPRLSRMTVMPVVASSASVRVSSFWSSRRWRVRTVIDCGVCLSDRFRRVELLDDSVV